MSFIEKWNTGNPEVKEGRAEQFIVSYLRRGVPGLPYRATAYYLKSYRTAKQYIETEGWYTRSPSGIYKPLLDQGDVVCGWQSIASENVQSSRITYQVNEYMRSFREWGKGQGYDQRLVGPSLMTDAGTPLPVFLSDKTEHAWRGWCHALIHAEEVCPRCLGSGMIDYTPNGPDSETESVLCPHCLGSGSLPDAYEGVVKALDRANGEITRLQGKIFMGNLRSEQELATVDVEIQGIAAKHGVRDSKSYEWSFENHNLYKFALELLKLPVRAVPEEHENLKSEHKKLQEEYNTLQAKMVQLRKDYDSLVALNRQSEIAAADAQAALKKVRDALRN